jgi:hypothetical protein
LQQKANDLWDRFLTLSLFILMCGSSLPAGASCFTITSKSRRDWTELQYLSALNFHQFEIAGHHQRLLEHASERQLDELKKLPMDGIKAWTVATIRT